jgi:hypothetical protein
MAKKTGRAVSKQKSAKPAHGKAKTATAKPAAVRSKRKTLTATKPRRLKQAQYKSLRLQKRIKHPVKLPNVWRLTKTAAMTLWVHRRLFIGITLVYGVLNLILVQGFGNSTDVANLKSELSQVFTGNFGSLASSLSIFVVLIGGSGNSSSQTAGAYQLFLGLITSLAIIWALRQVLAGAKLRVRDAYYRGMYPLVPFILVLLIIGVQFLPLLIGSLLYGTVTSNGIAVYFAEKFIWAVLYGLLALLSIYMVSSSIFALYIVTLPDMTPLKALRSARELVRYRRWTVLRKVLCMPVILLIIAALIMLPIIIWLTPLTQWVFFLLTMSALVGAHAYVYTLYRELLNE